jgi:2-hydroxychromene-2-carboxylate isomerase
MTCTIEFYFDFPSPYSYLAHTQLPKIAAEHGATVIYHPFRILELMTIVGNRPTTIECKNKGKYAVRICSAGPSATMSTLLETHTRNRSILPNSTAGH